MHTTTTHTTWARLYQGYATPRDTITAILGERAGDYDLDGIETEYRQAVSSTLGDGWVLAGDQIIGPVEVDVDAEQIRGDIDSVDLMGIVVHHDWSPAGLAEQLQALGGLESVERVRAADRLARLCKTGLARVRAAAVYEATRERTWEAVAADLGTTTDTVGRLVGEHNRRRSVA